MVTMNSAVFDANRYSRWLNPQLNPAKLRRKFAREGKILAIDDVLVPDVADYIHTFLAGGMPEGWWTVVVSGSKGTNYLYNTPENQPAIEEHLRVMRAGRTGHADPGDGTYIPAYTFKRTWSNHYPTCNCPVCDFNNFLVSQPMAEFVRAMFGAYMKPREVFASKYTVGDHLDPHSDAVSGRRIAFVFNFTRDWRTEYGGLLVFTDPPPRVLVPGYNRLTVFDVTGRGLPHHVTDVTSAAGDRKRLAISGWLGADVEVKPAAADQAKPAAESKPADAK